MTTQASSEPEAAERRHLDMASYIAQVKAFRMQAGWDGPVGIDEAIFNGMVWGALCAEVAPEFLIAFAREAQRFMPVVRLAGTPENMTPQEKVREDIQNASNRLYYHSERCSD